MFWHLFAGRARVQIDPLALDVGGVSPGNQALYAGARVRIVGRFWLGADLTGYFNNGSQIPMSSQWGRELWLTRLFGALQIGS